MIHQQAIHRTLEATFLTIQQERMQGVPVINDKLCVKAIGFHEWNNHQLGILMTPWFMNLIVLSPPSSDAKTADEPVKIGSVHTYLFPSGCYDFVMGYEEGLGYYQSCSLFSPMFEFEDQAAAELTAKAALAAIIDEGNIDTVSQNRAEEIAQRWQGETTKNKPQQLLSERIEERLHEPTSRRDFLRGKIFSAENK